MRRECPSVDLYSWSLQNRTEQAPWLPDLGQFFTESYGHLNWKKTFKISDQIKWSYLTNQAWDSKPCLSVPYLHVFYIPPGMFTQSLPWAFCVKAWKPFQCRNFFPSYQFKPPGIIWGHFLSSSHLVAGRRDQTPSPYNLLSRSFREPSWASFSPD